MSLIYCLNYKIQSKNRVADPFYFDIDSDWRIRLVKKTRKNTYFFSQFCFYKKYSSQNNDLFSYLRVYSLGCPLFLSGSVL